MGATLAEVVELLLAGLEAQLPEGFVPAGIEVQLGALLDVDPAALRASLEAALPGLEIRILVTPAAFRCLDCGAEYPQDEFPCPVCGSPNHEILQGNELQILRAWGPAPG
jgi:Zn finger protein HypA/HybF involved in hydrogenase expression